MVFHLLSLESPALSPQHPVTYAACQGTLVLAGCPASLYGATLSVHEETITLCKLICCFAYLFCNLLPHSCKHGCSVDILLVSDVRDVHQNGGLAMNEAVQDMFLKSWQVIGDLLALAHAERVVAVGEEDGLELAVVVQEVALVDVRQLDLVLLAHTAQKGL